MKILVVDDSSAIVTLIRDILSPRGYQIEIAKDGQTALQKYRVFKPDVVTLDLSMPGMNGYETLSRILEIDRYANVVIITASDHDVALQECMKRGAAGYLMKPFTPNDLVGTIQQASINTKSFD